MAAPGDGEAVWNRWDVPWPACNAAEAAPAEHAAVICLSAVLKRCWAVDNMLNSKMLVAEQSLLHSIIYNFHYQMIHQRAYGSLKQVEQCLKRLNLMNLEKSIQEIAQIGLIKQRSENPKESLVPSQPVIEVVLVKILGSCKLVLRLLECCCTAFTLIVKHLCLEEYVLFNTLVLGLLSRLWILYRAVLKNLSALYKDLFELLQEVAKMHQRPYIKGFVFPSEINDFLGTSSLEIKKKMPKAFIEKKAGTGWMNTFFSVKKTTSQSQILSAVVPPAVRKKKKKRRKGTQNTSDIGKPVLINRTNQDLAKKLEFDLKTLCKYPNPVPQEIAEETCCVKATICKYLTLQSCRQKPMQRLRASPQQSTRLSWKQSCVSQSMSVHRGPVSKRTASPFLDQCFPLWIADSSGTKTLEESIHDDISVPAVLESHCTHIEKRSH